MLAGKNPSWSTPWPSRLVRAGHGGKLVLDVWKGRSPVVAGLQDDREGIAQAFFSGDGFGAFPYAGHAWVERHALKSTAQIARSASIFVCFFIVGPLLDGERFGQM